VVRAQARVAQVAATAALEKVMAALEEAKAALSEANSALERPSFPEPNWFELCNVQIIPGPSPCYLVQINDNYNYCGPPRRKRELRSRQ